MTLATRCPSCVTVFKVVQDQLRVSDGWVRCGRCNEVFNAVDHLVDFAAPPGPALGSAAASPVASARNAGAVPPTAAPAPWSSPPDAEFGAQAVSHVDPGDPLAVADAGFDLSTPTSARHAPWSAEPVPAGPEAMVRDEPSDVLAPQEFRDNGSDVEPVRDIVLDDDERRLPGSEGSLAADVAALPGGLDKHERGSDSDLRVDHDTDGATLSSSHAATVDLERPPVRNPADTPTAEASTEPAPVPQFLREAERAARWQQPRVRRALMAGCAGAGLLLVAQVGLEYRDLLAARWPVLQPPLVAACRIAGCRIEPPRWIEAVAVDSSGLVRVEGTSTYRFSVVLANRAGFALALPSIDLTLTDVRGQVVARRMLRPLDLGHDGDRLDPGTELPLRATLAVSERVVAGYTIEIYYP